MIFIGLSSIHHCVPSDGVIAIWASMQWSFSASSAVVRNAAAEEFDSASISLSDNSGENRCLTMRTSCPYRSIWTFGRTITHLFRYQGEFSKFAKRPKPRGCWVEMINWVNSQWFHKFLWIWMRIFKKGVTFTIKRNFPSNAIYYLLTTVISHFFFLNSCSIAYATEAEGRKDCLLYVSN